MFHMCRGVRLLRTQIDKYEQINYAFKSSRVENRNSWRLHVLRLSQFGSTKCALASEFGSHEAETLFLTFWVRPVKGLKTVIPIRI